MAEFGTFVKFLLIFVFDTLVSTSVTSQVGCTNAGPRSGQGEQFAERNCPPGQPEKTERGRDGWPGI